MNAVLFYVRAAGSEPGSKGRVPRGRNGDTAECDLYFSLIIKLKSPQMLTDQASAGIFTLEAPPGFGPGIKVLQTSALPLGYGAGWGYFQTGKTIRGEQFFHPARQNFAGINLFYSKEFWSNRAEKGPQLAF